MAHTHVLQPIDGSKGWWYCVETGCTYVTERPGDWSQTTAFRRLWGSRPTKAAQEGQGRP